MSLKKQKAAGIAFALILLLFWQTAALIIGKAYILPGPADVIVEIIANSRELFLIHFPATMKIFFTGFMFAFASGLFFAVLMDLNKHLEKAVYPILTVTQTIPVICVAPVFILWFGYSFGMRVLVVVLANFFTFAINIFDGFRSANKERLELLSTYGAKRSQIYSFLKFPSALPDLFTAIKVCIPWSVTAAAVSEWLGASAGLGTYSRISMMNLNPAGVIAPVVILTAVALILSKVISIIENKVVFWVGET